MSGLLELILRSVESLALDLEQTEAAVLEMVGDLSRARRTARLGDAARDLAPELLTRVFGFALAVSLTAPRTAAGQSLLSALAGTCRRWRAVFLETRHALWLGLPAGAADAGLTLCTWGPSHRPVLMDALPAACAGAYVACGPSLSQAASRLLITLTVGRPPDDRFRNAVLVPALRARGPWLLAYLAERVNVGADDAPCKLGCELLAACLSPDDPESAAEADLARRAVRASTQCEAAAGLARDILHPTRAPYGSVHWFAALIAEGARPRHAEAIADVVPPPEDYAAGDPRGIESSGLGLVLSLISPAWSDRMVRTACSLRRRNSAITDAMRIAALARAGPEDRDRALTTLLSIKERWSEEGFQASLGALHEVAVARLELAAAQLKLAN